MTDNNMEVISHLNISVGLFPFSKILNVSISHHPNSFGRCEIVGEMDPTVAEEVSNRIDETSQTEVVTSAKGQPERLFCGIVGEFLVSYQNEYASVRVVLLDTCACLDRVTHQRSYQNTSLTYGDLIKKCMEGEGTAAISVTDKKTGTLVVQYDETNWQFSVRMASQLGAPVITDISAEKPNLYVGLPPSDQTKDLTTSTYQIGKATQLVSSAGANSQSMVSEYGSSGGVTSYQYLFIGNFVKLGDKFYAVKSVDSSMVDGILEMNYGLLPIGNEVPADGDVPALGSIAQAPISNGNCCGKMLSGTVQNVAGNKVQVQFSFDSEFSGDHWFEYSTAYSSSDQNGWYCMPEKGDVVRVFFPSGSEGEAFAASSASKFASEDPKDKCWIAHGKQIVLTEKGIHISCENNSIMIDLPVDDGIVIESEKSISINAVEELTVHANSVHISADNQISLGTDRAFIDISEGKITLLGNEVAIE